MRRRWTGLVRRGIPTALAVAALAACDRAGDGARPLTIAISTDGGPINPYSGSSDYLIGFVYDKLFEPSPFVAEPVAGLARTAEQVDDTTWLVTLRQGVRWHDGTPFTADDVRFTYEYYRDGPPTRYGHHVSAVPHIAHIDVIDSTTVRFRCGYPCPLLGRVTFADLPIIPRHIWEGVTEPRRFDALPVGTGPYQLVEYLPDRLYRLRANEAYYRGAPAVDEIVLPVLGDQSNTFLALRTGQIDAAARKLPPELVPAFDSVASLRLASTAALSIVELRPNYRKPPFDDGAFRRALSLAVDRGQLVERVLLGRGRPGVQGYPHPDSPWTDPTLRTPYDAAASRALLDSLGYTDRDGDGVREGAGGMPLRFTLHVSAGEPTWVRSGELLVEQFRDVGIALTLRTMEAAALSDFIASRGHDLFISEIGAHGVADPDQFIMSQRSGYLWEPSLPNPPLEALFAAWQAERDLPGRNAAHHRIQQHFNANPTSIALFYPQEFWAYRPAAYDRWAESPAYGIVNKWSFLPDSARAGAVTREFGDESAVPPAETARR